MSKITFTDDAGNSADIPLPSGVVLSVAPPAPAYNLDFTLAPVKGLVWKINNNSTLPDGTTCNVFWGPKGATSQITATGMTTFGFPSIGPYTVTMKAKLADGTVLSKSQDIVVTDLSDPPPADNPAPPTNTPTPPISDPVPPVVPIQDPEIPVNSNATHVIVATVPDGAGREWSATVTVGNDPSAPRQYKKLANAQGVEHPRLAAHFHDDGVHIHVARADAKYDEVGCGAPRVTYDGVAVPVPPSSYADGTYDFWAGCMMPMIRYGKQAEPDFSKIDWSLLASYDLAHPQQAVDLSKFDFTWNGNGATTMPKMSTTGMRGEIGYLPTIAVAFLSNPCAATWNALRKMEDWAANWHGVYFCHPDTGDFLDVETYPHVTTMPTSQAQWADNPIAPYGGSYRGDTLTPPSGDGQISGSHMAPNGAHLTGYFMLTPMLTRATHDLEHASFWANWPLQERNPDNRQAEGIVLGVSERRFAWCLRDLFIASYYSSNTAYFQRRMARQLEIFNGIPQNEFGLPDWGQAYAGSGSANGCKGIAVWQTSYDMVVLDPVANKQPEWKPVAQYLGKFYALLGALPQAPFMTTYAWIGFDANENVIPDLMQQCRNTLVTSGWTDEMAQAATAPTATAEDVYNLMVQFYTAKGKTWPGKFANGVCDYYGMDNGGAAYPATAIAATITAANVGTPGIEAALARVQNIPTPPAYDNDYWHLKLREAA